MSQRDNRQQIKVRLGKHGQYHEAVLTIYREEPDRSTGFPGMVDVEDIEIDPAVARNLLIEIVSDKLERALALAQALDYLDDVRVDL